MTDILIFIFGVVIGISADSFLETRATNNDIENKKKMMIEINKDIKNGYKPDLKLYKKKYNL